MNSESQHALCDLQDMQRQKDEKRIKERRKNMTFKEFCRGFNRMIDECPEEDNPFIIILAT